MTKAFKRLSPDKRHEHKENYEWLLTNFLRIKPEEDPGIIEMWKMDLEVLNNVIGEKI